MDVAYLVERIARRSPDRELWKLANRSISYREGFDRIDRFARFLEDQTPRRARIALLTNNRFEALEAYLGTLRSGRVAVPIHVRLSPTEVEYILSDSQASVLVHAPELSETIRDVAGSAGVSQLIAFSGKRGEEAGDSGGYEHSLDHAGSRRPAPPDPDDTAWLFYTSGTTGKPKGAQETHRNLVTMVEQFLIHIIPDASPSDCYMHVAPISHSSTSCALPYLSVGASNAFHESWSFNAAEVLAGVERFGVTSTFLVPTMIHDLEKAMPTDHDVSTLQTIIYGGGPAYESTMTRAREKFGEIFAQFYGQGEAPVTITGISKHERRALLEAGEHEVLNSVGRECTAIRLEVRDGERGEPVQPGTPGEIWVRGDLVMKGYWNLPDATAETIREGWLNTGDVGRLDENGYLYLTDRSKDVIISGGSNVYPREIEELVLTGEGIEEAAVFGLPDERWGEIVAIAVKSSADKPATIEGVWDLLGDRIASYKRPRVLVNVEELPKNPAGKVMKTVLRDRFSDPGSIAG